MPSSLGGASLRQPLLVLVIAGLTVLSGCADDPAEELRATCGPIAFSSFPPDLDEFPPLDDDAAGAIDELANGATAVEAAGFDTSFDWSIVSRSDDALVLFGQGVGPDEAVNAYARFSREQGAWRPRGWGGCSVEIAAPGFGPASTALDPARPIDRASTDLPLLIRELECASGQAPVDREVVPVVIEDEGSVTVIVLVAPVSGDVECPGNPWHPITVSLDAPLGDRVLLDGSRPPAEPVGDPD